jgi:hypothetical protein
MIKEGVDHVGKSWITEFGSTIFVYDVIAGSRFAGKTYKLACSICSKDHELFPEILMHRTGTRDETTSCACSKKVIYSGYQQYVRCSRKAMDLGVEFLGFKDGFRRRQTHILYSCLEHGGEHSTDLPTFLARKNCCPETFTAASLKTKLESDSSFTEKVMKKGRFTEGTQFKRVGLTSMWEVHCAKCKKDDYAKSGISSVWTAIGSSISLGRVQCRCSERHCWTKEEYRKRIELSGISFVEWVEPYTGNHHNDRFLSRCEIHGERDVSVAGALTGRGCPGCADRGFDQCKNGYIYCLKSEDGALVKIGITHDTDDRFQRLRRYTPFEFTVEAIRGMKGHEAAKLEKEILSGFMSAELRGFDGATEWIRYDDRISSYFA